LQSTDVIPVTFKRNASWQQSAGLALRASLWFAPLSFVRAFQVPVLALLAGSVQLGAMLVTWLVSRVVILVAGLAGYICEGKA
jgi:hypothetical protein